MHGTLSSPTDHETLALTRVRQSLLIGRVGTWTWYVRTNITEWDASLWALFGQDVEGTGASRAEAVLEFIHPEDRVLLFDATRGLIERGEEFAVEVRYIHTDGSTRWLLSRAQLFRSADNAPHYLQGICADITPLKAVESRLKRMIRTLKAARVATFFWDPMESTITWEDEAGFSFPSPAGVENGVDIEFVLSRIHESDRDRTRAAFQHAAQSGEALRLTCLAADDTQTGARWLEAVVAGTSDAIEGEQTLAGAFVDVTLHKQLERELTEAKNRLHIAVMTGEIGTQVWDMRSGQNDTDGVWERIYGMTPDEQLRLGFDEFLGRVDPRDRASTRDHFTRACQSTDTVKWMYRYHRPDGAKLWVSASSRTEADEHGKPWRLVSAVVDITYLKRAEERLRTQSEVSATLARIDSIAEALSEVLELVRMSEQLACAAFWLVDDEGQTLRCVGLRVDAEAEKNRLIDAVRDQVLVPGQGIVGGLLQAEARDPAHASDAFAALVQAEQFVPISVETVNADQQCVGVLAFYGRAQRVDDDLGALVHFVGEQIGSFVRRRTAEHDLRTLNAELEARVSTRTRELENANKELALANKELESFSYSVSHDLRAPLRTLDGFSQMLSAECGTLIPQEGQRLIQAIRDGAVRMGELIDDLLNFSRLGRAQLRKRPFAMAELVSECLSNLAPSHAHRDVSIHLGPLEDANGDRSLLRQVWVNLLSNAIKYSGKCAHAEIGIRSYSEAGEIVYEVKDNGAGFDMRYAHKLFGVFRRLHRAEDYEGTGVGLAIVQRIVQRHGGRIWVDAAPGRGATFSFTLAASGIAP